MRLWSGVAQRQLPLNQKRWRTSVRFRVIVQMTLAVLYRFTSFNHLDLDHPLAIFQLTRALAYPLFGAKRSQTFDLFNGSTG